MTRRPDDPRLKEPSHSAHNLDFKKIRRANRAAAVGQLMLGQISSWDDYDAVDHIDGVAISRWQLRSGRNDVDFRLGAEIEKFCTLNFDGMSIDKLDSLYDDIKSSRGLDMPLTDFEEKICEIKPEVRHGSRRHVTLDLSLQGLAFWTPEDELVADISIAFSEIERANEVLRPDTPSSHKQPEPHEIVEASRRERFAARAALLAIFNLAEAYVNSLAWEIVDQGLTSELNKKDRRMVEHSSGSLRERFKRLPEILNGGATTAINESAVQLFDNLKPFRDSLCHPSPLPSTRLAGRSKSAAFRRAGTDTAVGSLFCLINAIDHVEEQREQRTPPDSWFQDLKLLFGDPPIAPIGERERDTAI